MSPRGLASAVLLSALFRLGIAFIVFVVRALS